MPEKEIIYRKSEICCPVVGLLYNNPPHQIHRVSSRQTGLLRSADAQQPVLVRCSLRPQQVLQVLYPVCDQLLQVYNSSAAVLDDSLNMLYVPVNIIIRCILLIEREKGGGIHF